MAGGCGTICCELTAGTVTMWLKVPNFRIFKPHLYNNYKVLQNGVFISIDPGAEQKGCIWGCKREVLS